MRTLHSEGAQFARAIEKTRTQKDKLRRKVRVTTAKTAQPISHSASTDEKGPPLQI